MGVPKFYRWISERYPCLSQIIQEQQIPGFDNLYLDMNGIIHPCSHPNDDDPHFRKSEEEVFEDIFHYIEVLFRIIKPKQVFFMAVDGVAPRAKMNQQRGRRFRSAKEAEDNIRKALEKGQVLPEEERFDSNCITPGTPFMVRLHEQLKFFVSYKISTDPAWQGLRVYLSGHETPGEGEHKIMEFIRSEKVRPDYDPNTRHCLYGLDADLIMLGLSSHEPHFSLLREEVRFGKAAKRITKPEKTTFHLLHLSLLREYLDWEFSGVKDKLSFPYDLERIIDDWILMGFLVGNDFIPHLPNLHINHDALPYLYKLYIDVLPSLDGYLHDSGELILPRFEKYLTALSKFDREQFEEKFVDMKWFESKMGFKLGDGPPAMHAEEDHLALENSFATLEGISEDPTISSSVKHKGKMNPELEKLAARFDEELGDDNDESDEDTFEIEFAMFKRDYYMQKLGYKDIDNDVMAEQTLQYVTGIQWILSYYFSGVPSWSWFYPFHYAPYMSDIRNFSEVNISFDLGTPFLPFEQLLAVLPAASRQLLPQPLQNLMIMEQSPIIEYYPVNFKTDLNGKQQEWEAVVLIPFIDERRLLEAMTPLYSRLTDEEIARNRHGPCLLCTYNPSLNFVCRSSLPGRFPDISCCHAMCEELSRDVFLVDIKHMHRGLSDGVKLDVYYPGFPTLYHVAHKAELKKANVKVFQMHSKNNSMILQISEPQEKTEPLRVAEEWLGETCYVGWPHMVEALVVGVCDGVYRYGLQKNTSRITPKETLQELLTKVQIDSWKHQVSSLTEYHMERRGIEFGETNVLIEACPIRGKRFVCGVKGLVTVEKEWSPTPSSYPSQLTVKDILVPECDEEHKIHTIEELFPIDSACFMLASPYYGALGEVIEIDIKQSRVRVQLHVPSEPDVSSVINQHQALSLRYLPAHVVAKKLGISPFLLSRITGTFLVKQGSSQDASGGRSKFDIGLNMKFSKQNKEVLGYARRTEEGAWTFSPTAHKTIAEYLHKFPLLFETLAKMSSKDQLYENDLAPQNDGSASLSDVQHWLKTVPAVNLEPVKCGSFSLDEPVVEAIDRAVHQAKALNQKPKTVKVRVRPHLLFRPSEQLGAIPPDSEAWFELFDRVVNVKLNVAVPFGLRGTVIGIHQGDDSTDAMYEVLFDEPFLGGQPLRCSSNKVNLMAASSLINISHGERCEAKKVDVKSPPRSQQYQHDSRTSHRSAFSPNLGASPELAKQNRNLANRSPDVRLDSSGSPGFGRGIPAKSSPHSVQVNSKHSVPAGSHQSQMASSRTVNSEERNFKPPKLQKGPQSQPRNPNDGLSEFADMWKELKLKENSSPDNKGSNTADTNKEDKSVSKSEASNTLAEEGTQALRELLQIKEKQTVDPLKDGKQQHEPQPTRGRQLSLDDLFRSQGSAQAAVVPQPSPHQAPGSLPSFVLLNWCCAVGLRPPNFHYSVTPQGVIAVVEMSNGFKFPGGVCRDRGEAAESASSVALFQLPRIMPSFPSPLHVTAPQPFVGLPQQFAHGGLARPAHPVIPPVFQTLQAKLPRSPPKHETLQQHSPQQRPDLPTTGNLGPSSMLARDSVSLSDKDVAASLNASASPFVPLQVARRNSGTRQPSPAKDESLAPLESPGNVELIEEAEPDHHDQRAASPAHNKPAAVPQETDPLSPPRTEKPAGSLKKTQNSKQRLLAPSFFSKKR